MGSGPVRRLSPEENFTGCPHRKSKGQEEVIGNSLFIKLSFKVVSNRNEPKISLN